jgi:hypothetical protein
MELSAVMPADLTTLLRRMHKKSDAFSTEGATPAHRARTKPFPEEKGKKLKPLS